MNNSFVESRPESQFLGLHFLSWLIFLLPALALTTPFGISLIEAVVVLCAIYFAKPLWQQRAELFRPAKWIIFAFGINLIVVTASVAFLDGKVASIDNASRQLVLVVAIGITALTRPKAQWFWYGLFAGTFGAACLALYQRFGLHIERPGGFHQVIMFGDIAIAMGLMSLASIQIFSKTRLAILPYVGFLSGVCASILSGSRGGWIALILAFIPLYSYGRRAFGRKIIVAAIVGGALMTVAYLIPQLGVAERIELIAKEIAMYQQGDSFSSIGLRIEAWKGAWMMFIEHPLVGVGKSNFNPALNELIAHGEISPAMHGFYHAHNELLHALATQGIIGASVLLLLYAAPFLFFLRYLRRNNASQPYALAGLLLVLAFADFGLTQVLFSHHIGAAFYALTISVLAGICITMQRAEQ